MKYYLVILLTLLTTIAGATTYAPQGFDAIRNPNKTKTWTLPSVTGTISCIACTETLSNKSISGGQITSAVATATALAANGANCSAGQFPLGVDASGAVESCTALPTTITGTANQITASASTGAITLSIPSSPTLPGTTTGTFSGNITGNVTGTADNATNTAITNDTATNATMYPTWVTTTTGNLPQKVSSTKMTFNPSTGMLTTTGITAAVTGNASTATALAANGTNCSAGQYGLGVDASGNSESCGAITVLGTIATGVWNGTAVDATHGGTGLTSLTANRVPYASASNTIGTSSSFTFDGTTLFGAVVKNTNLLVNSVQLSVSQQSNTFDGGVAYGIGIKQSNGGNAGAFLNFFNSADAAIGSVTQSGASNVVFNTASDYRLKENLRPLPNALERIEALRPLRYDFKNGGSKDSEGFLAHELQKIVPYAVTGKKDAMRDGKIDPQMVDYSKLTPLLVKAVQDLSARVKQLESEKCQ